MAQDWDKFKGNVKQATGDLTNDQDLEREGKLDEIKGRIDEAVEDFTNKVRSFFD